MTDTIQDLQSQIDNLESMLTHASNTIARLEGRWRAPGAAKCYQIGLVVAQGTLILTIAQCIDNGGEWIFNGDRLKILAWCELPPMPSAEMHAGLE